MGIQGKLHGGLLVVLTIIALINCTPSSTASPTCEFGPSLAQKFNELNYKANEKMTLNCSHSCSRLDCSGILSLVPSNGFYSFQKSSASDTSKPLHMREWVKVSNKMYLCSLRRIGFKVSYSFLCGYVKTSPYEQKLSVTEVFCFGLSLNHCDNPASLGFYLNVPSKSVFKYGKLTHGETDAIPGPDTELGKISFVLKSNLTHINATYLQYGLEIYVKVTFHRIDVFPYKFVIIPPQFISVPPCALHTTDAPMPTAVTKCVAPNRPVTTPQTTPQMHIKSKTYNTSCELGLFQCGTNEMCTAIDDNSEHRMNGVCRCELEAKLSPLTGLCEKNTVTTPAPSPHKTSRVTTDTHTPTPAAKKSSNTEKKTGPSTTVIIVASIVGGVILSAIVVGTIICIGRRRRNNRYRDRLQLLTDDDDDLNTNVVI